MQLIGLHKSFPAQLPHLAQDPRLTVAYIA